MLGSALLQLIFDFVERNHRALLIKIAARCPADAGRADHLVAHLDRHPATQQQEAGNVDEVRRCRVLLRAVLHRERRVLG